MIYYVIPARKGSKGFPLKNRKMFDYTYDIIPRRLLNNTIVTSDDKEILKKAVGCKKIERDTWLADDVASTKFVICDVVIKQEMADDDIIIMLYLTYPQRTWDDVNKAYDYFQLSSADSLLCKKEPKTHPYLCVYRDGTQVVPHDLYRRQDYPAIWEISHFISIFKVSELKFLNNNLYNAKTVYYPIDDVIDVDYEKDFKKI